MAAVVMPAPQTAARAKTLSMRRRLLKAGSSSASHRIVMLAMEEAQAAAGGGAVEEDAWAPEALAARAPEVVAAQPT